MFQKDQKMVQQISFYVDSLSDLKQFHGVFKEESVRIERTVSHGNAFGMYALDPEGNTIEVYFRTGFHVPQPCADPVNLEDSEESLLDPWQGPEFLSRLLVTT